MGFNTGRPKPYYSKYEKIEVKNSGWFDVFRLPHDVYTICEHRHFQEVNLYLIVGSERALLLDTGLGIRDLRPLVHELYSGELITVNSHFHFDHIGNNHDFEPVYIYDDPLAISIAGHGAPREALGNQLDEEMFFPSYPDGFDPAAFSIRPYSYKLMHEDDVFDLGNRQLRVIHTPGHSNDCIMLYDEKNGILFAGDMFYTGALYAHMDCGEFGRSEPVAYLESLRKVLSIVPEDTAVYCSHNDFIVSTGQLRAAADAFDFILSGGAGADLADVTSAHEYLEAGKPLKRYMFNGFSIICRDE